MPPASPSGRFAKGALGNPAGKPPGSRNRATQIADVMFDGKIEALSRKAVELALGDDPVGR